MGTTTNYEFRYPEAGATNNVPSDMKNLADDVDAALQGAVDGIGGDIPDLNSVDADVSSSAPGDAADAGTSAEAARADHVHERESVAIALAGPADLSVFSEACVSQSGSGTIHIDLSAAREFVLTFTGNATIAFDNVPATGGKTITWSIEVISNGHTATWPVAVSWGTQLAPVLSAGGLSDHVVFKTNNAGVKISGFIAGEGY